MCAEPPPGKTHRCRARCSADRHSCSCHLSLQLLGGAGTEKGERDGSPETPEAEAAASLFPPGFPTPAPVTREEALVFQKLSATSSCSSRPNRTSHLLQGWAGLGIGDPGSDEATSLMWDVGRVLTSEVRAVEIAPQGFHWLDGRSL